MKNNRGRGGRDREYWQGAILCWVIKEDLIEQRSEKVRDGTPHIFGERHPGRGNSKYKGPEVRGGGAVLAA